MATPFATAFNGASPNPSYLRRGTSISPYFRGR